MKKVLMSAVALAMPVFAFAAVDGVWQTEPNTDGYSGLVQISACGDAYCGVMVGNTGGSDKYKGQTIISGMTTTDGVNFTGGTLYDPTENNKAYDGKMTLDGDMLSVSGCVLGGLACKSQNWARAN